MTELVTRIQENLQSIQHRIAQAAVSAGRNPADIRLVVVTKSQPISVVEAAIQAGSLLLGENYPEESVDKITALRDLYPAVEWHMIGHLQSRKSAIVARYFDLFQSLDRIEIAEKLNDLLRIAGRRLPVLLEFNTGGENSKSGWDATNPSIWPGLLPEVHRLATLPNLEIRGLMTMPPLSEDPDQSRPYFQRLRQLRDFLRTELPEASWSELSMGTSSDFEVAVQEGATLVRIGTAILGPRPIRHQTSN